MGMERKDATLRKNRSLWEYFSDVCGRIKPTFVEILARLVFNSMRRRIPEHSRVQCRYSD